jgi:hypothetical protein
MKEYVIFIDDPKRIELLRTIINGEKPLSEIKRLLTYRKTRDAFEGFRQLAKAIEYDIVEFLNQPLKDSFNFNFFKKSQNICRGKSHECVALNDYIEVSQLRDDLIRVRIRLDKINEIDEVEHSYTSASPA